MLRLISYLAPSIPAGFFELVARTIADACATDVDLRFETSISGPLPGDPDPFAGESADIGFVCAPTFRWLHDELDLLPAPVPEDRRAADRPVYFADVVVRSSSSVASVHDLRGQRWAYNDQNSRSGWFSMAERIAPAAPGEFFSSLIQSGSHLESLRLVAGGAADAAAIDSNALHLERRRNPSAVGALRVVESWGPFPIQPVVIRSAVAEAVKRAARDALLRAHEHVGEELRSFGFVRFAEVSAADYA